MIKKFFAVLLAVVLLAGCGMVRDDDTQSRDIPVIVKTAGGMALSGIRIELYRGDALAETRVTDRQGRVVFPNQADDDYIIRLGNVPLGYTVAETYPLDGNTAEITLFSAPVPAGQQSGSYLRTGDVMYDLTITTADGEKLTVSEILKEKKLLMLNFWFENCPWCRIEFPVMELAYQRYRQDVEILALNPADTTEQIQTFAEKNSLSFPMAHCSGELPLLFGVGGYPTSVFIDRYGVICLIQPGAIPGAETFYTVFDHFTGDDYAQKLYDSISQLMG